MNKNIFNINSDNYVLLANFNNESKVLLVVTNVLKILGTVTTLTTIIL